MSKREKIIDKIKALLKMTTDRGCSEAEALSCALKAQQLIAEYDVSKSEIYDEEPPRIIESQVDIAIPSSMREYLASVIAGNFRCRYYNNSLWNAAKLKYEYHIVFVGYEQDATAATLVFEKLYKVGNRLASKARRENPNVPDIYRGYFAEFILGIKSELDKQCEALMLVLPLAVNEYYEDVSTGFKKARKTKRIVQYLDHEDIYNEAFRNGVDAVRKSRMDGDSIHLLNPAIEKTSRVPHANL